MADSDVVAIFETFERASLDYPEGSYLFRVGNRFIKATGRFEGLATELDPEGVAWLRLASLHRLVFINWNMPVDGRWGVKKQSTALVKEGPKAMVVCR